MHARGASPDVTPLVSVILPTYNREGNLLGSIRSVLDQEGPDLELIVVDDGSTDRTPALVEALDDPRLVFERSEENRGGSAARNRGLARARGELIAFQDAGDLWLPGKLRRQVDWLQESRERRPDVGAVYCRYRRVHDGSVEIVPAAGRAPTTERLLEPLLRGNFIGTPTVVLTRACLERVGGFDEELPRFQDWELMIRVAVDHRIGFVEEVLVDAPLAEDGVTGGHDERLIRAERRIVEKHRDLLRAAGPEIHAYRLWHLAHLCFMAGRDAEGRTWLDAALAERPRSEWRVLRALSRVPAAYRMAYSAFRALR